MKLKDVIELIRFNTATANDLSGKAVNNIISNRAIKFQLQSALDRYASRTKGLEGIYSTPLSTSQDYITAPTLALRSQAYKFAQIWINGQSYPIDIPSISVQNDQAISTISTCIVFKSSMATVERCLSQPPVSPGLMTKGGPGRTSTSCVWPYTTTSTVFKDCS